jgi:hypothetical protein
MGEHKYREASLKIKLLVFVGGVLIVTACIYRIGYLPPLGIIGAHATGKMLGVGAILIVGPIWAVFRKRRRQH